MSKILIGVLAAFACVCFTGCIPIPTRSVSKPNGAGYGLVSWGLVGRTFAGRREEVCYWDAKGKRTSIWQSLADKLVCDGDIALFHGYVYGSPKGSGHERFFAVHGAGPAADITDQLVLLWGATAGTNLSQTLNRGRVDEIERHEHSFRVHVQVIMGGHGTVDLSREKILEIIGTVRAQGTMMKDGRYDTPYFVIWRQS